MNIIRYLYARSNLQLIIALICTTLGGLVGTGLIKVMTDGIAGRQLDYPFVPVFVALCLALLFTRAFAQLIVLRLTQGAVFDTRLRITRKIIASPLRRIEEIGKSKLLVVLTKDIESFAQCLQIAPQVLSNLVVIICSLAYLAWQSWVWFLMFTAFLSVSLIGFKMAQGFPSRQIRLVRERLDTLYRLFGDLLDGTKELQLNKARGQYFVSEVIEPVAQEYKRNYVRGFSAFVWIANVGDITFYGLIGFLLFVVPTWLGMPMPADLRITIGLILMYLLGPISSLSNSAPAIRQASIALEKINRLETELGAAPLIEMVNDPFGDPSMVRLELSELRYSYQGQTANTSFFLGPLDVSFLQGQITFVVGSNGSGKSTLAKILSGLYMAESGHLKLNGVHVTEANVEHYRRRFSAVFSDFHLFEHLMGVGSELDEARVTDYLAKLRIGHKVSLKEGQFSTVELSTGQRKRLALIVSYLEDRPIYLFDEWAADQDPLFKNFFYAELLPELKARGKTVIAISHDDAYFGHADRVIQIDEQQAEELAVLYG
jgi:putative ATP-binding cassette transporter